MNLVEQTHESLEFDLLYGLYLSFIETQVYFSFINGILIECSTYYVKLVEEMICGSQSQGTTPDIREVILQNFLL